MEETTEIVIKRRNCRGTRFANVGSRHSGKKTGGAYALMRSCCSLGLPAGVGKLSGVSPKSA